MRHLIFFIIFIISSILNAKVLIITHAFNRPDFIEVQYKTFKAFFKDEYEFIVFNDGERNGYKHSIENTCHNLNIKCINISQKIHDRPYLHRVRGEGNNDACVRCANVVQYSLDQIGFNHNGLVMIIDSDMFLVKEFSLVEHMKNCNLAGVPQSRRSLTNNNVVVHYRWNGLVFFNMNTLPNKQEMNFNCGIISGAPLDVGGYISQYLKKYPMIRLKTFSSNHVNNIGIQNLSNPFQNYFNKKPHNIEFLLNFTFLHYRGGGNWDNKSPKYHVIKTKILNDLIDELLKMTK